MLLSFIQAGKATYKIKLIRFMLIMLKHRIVSFEFKRKQNFP